MQFFVYDDETYYHVARGSVAIAMEIIFITIYSIYI